MMRMTITVAAFMSAEAAFAEVSKEVLDSITTPDFVQRTL